MVDGVLHSEIFAEGIQETLFYNDSHAMPEEPPVDADQQNPIEIPTINKPDLTGITVSSEPLVELAKPSISEPDKKFFHEAALSLLLNTTSTFALKLSFAKDSVKTHSAFEDVFYSAIKSLGGDYFKKFISEKITEDIDALFGSSKWSEFAKGEISAIVFKVLWEATVSCCVGGAIQIANSAKHMAADKGWIAAEEVKDTAEKESGTSKWPKRIAETVTKVLVKDSVQEMIAMPYIDPITKPYTDLKIGGMFSEFVKLMLVGYLLKGGDTGALLVKSAKLAVAKSAAQWVYDKYLKSNVNSCIDYVDEYTGFKESHSWCAGVIKAHVSSAFCKLPIYYTIH